MDGISVEDWQNGTHVKIDFLHDQVHPNLSGHKTWNNMIKKRLYELIKDGN